VAEGTPGTLVLRPVGNMLYKVGDATLMAWQIVKALPRPARYINATLQQAYEMGIKSIPLVLLIAFLGGAVTSQQTGAQFAGGLPLWVIGSVLAASVITELGPLLTAIVMMARVGAAIAAELASMKVTEQIDALYAMGRDPVLFLVVPRVLAGVMVLPLLVVLANAMGIGAGWAIGLLAVDGLTSADIIYGMRFYFRPWSLIFSVIKATEGVGRTTTTSVVMTTISLMILDVALAPMLKWF
jgi:phospholipid/cholesterol/gamma-HCH transport system permease protein